MTNESQGGREVLVGTYLQPSMLAELKAAAKHDRRSQSAYLLVLIEKDLARRRRRGAAKRMKTRKAA